MTGHQFSSHHSVDTSWAAPTPTSPVYKKDHGATRQFLTQYKWPVGLQNAYIEASAKFPMRFMILDDSGSMMANDGHYLLETSSGRKAVACSRWKELAEAMKFHAQLAHISDACTEFRLLNGHQPIIIGNSGQVDKFAPNETLIMLNEILDGSPGGGTPLCRHILDITRQIQAMAPQLKANGHKAVVTIATDGESSDGDIVEAMRTLQNLPVWVVIRLCTDDDEIVDYWNTIDDELELEIDVLDDLFGEAEEVNQFNDWLTYGEPLHRLREGGVHIKELDLIDEKVLSYDEMRHICSTIFGIGPASELPHPKHDWDGFFSLIKAANEQSVLCWDPLTQNDQYWIRERKLRASYEDLCAIMQMQRLCKSLLFYFLPIVLSIFVILSLAN